MRKKTKTSRTRNPAKAPHAAALCSCGEHAPHVVAERATADGKRLLLWSDGALTGGMGTHVVRGKRGAAQTAAAITAGWRVMGDATLYDWSEIPALAAREYKAALRG